MENEILCNVIQIVSLHKTALLFQLANLKKKAFQGRDYLFFIQKPPKSNNMDFNHHMKINSTKSFLEVLDYVKGDQQYDYKNYPTHTYSQAVLLINCICSFTLGLAKWHVDRSTHEDWSQTVVHYRLVCLYKTSNN